MWRAPNDCAFMSQTLQELRLRTVSRRILHQALSLTRLTSSRYVFLIARMMRIRAEAARGTEASPALLRCLGTFGSHCIFGSSGVLWTTSAGNPIVLLPWHDDNAQHV